MTPLAPGDEGSTNERDAVGYCRDCGISEGPFKLENGRRRCPKCNGALESIYRRDAPASDPIRAALRASDLYPEISEDGR